MPLFGEVGMASDDTTTPLGKWIGFLGEFHPMFLHLPIGAFALVLLMETLHTLTFKKYRPSTTLALFFASTTSILAVAFGYFLYLNGEYSGDTIEEHKRDGILFTTLLIATFLVKYAADTRPASRILKLSYLTGLLLTTGAMLAAGHHGGEISHGNPFDKAPWKPHEKKTSRLAPVIYTDIIHPILEAKCISCHGPKKQRGALRMDTYQLMLEGGKKTDCLVPGDLEKSTMISYLHLPIDDDLRMPPEKKEQLTDDEIAILEWWVSIGAPEHARLTQTRPSPTILELINARLITSPSSPLSQPDN